MKKDDKLLKALTNDDTRAFDRIFEKYSGYVCTVARNFSGGQISEQDIDDISADVFFKIWKYRKNLNIRAWLSAYLSSAVKNEVRYRYKKLVPCEDITELDIPADIFVEDMAEINEMMSCLNEGIMRLPEDDRELFLRFYLYGEKSADIAGILGITDNAARAGLRRIRLKLKEFMNERGYDHV